jgi:hypothetical protein
LNLKAFPALLQTPSLDDALPQVTAGLERDRLTTAKQSPRPLHPPRRFDPLDDGARQAPPAPRRANFATAITNEEFRKRY